MLGLQPLETAAENLRKIAREFAALSNVDSLRQQVSAVLDRLRSTFPQPDGTSLQARFHELCNHYLPGKPADDASAIRDVVAVIETRLDNLDAQNREAADLQKLANTQIAALVTSVRNVSDEIVRLAEPLVKERIAVLEAVAVYSADLEGDGTEVVCPACGSTVLAEDFKAHIESERTKLTTIDDLVRRHRDAIGTFIDEVQRIKGVITGQDLKKWVVSREAELGRSIRFLNGLNFNALRLSCNEADIQSIEPQLAKIIALATDAAGSAPPDVKDLIRDKQHAETLRDYFTTNEKAEKIKRIEALVAFVGRIEAAIRNEIRAQAESVFGTISGDIQRLWQILHPGQQITDVRLHVPEQADKR